LEDFSRGKSFADYEADEMLKSAIERQFEIIGEAFNQLSRQLLVDKLPELQDVVRTLLDEAHPCAT